MPSTQNMTRVMSRTATVQTDNRMHTLGGGWYYSASVLSRSARSECPYCNRTPRGGDRTLYILEQVTTNTSDAARVHFDCVRAAVAARYPGRVEPTWRGGTATQPTAAAAPSTARPVSTVGTRGIRIGADPELELIGQSGSIVSARSVGLDSLSAQLGCDGATYPVELRPSPGDAIQVTRNIARLLKRLEGVVKTNGNPTVRGGSGTATALGGHIHFSGIVNHPDLVAALDACIAAPLNSVSNPGRLNARQGQGYGRLGATRPQPHGWEYRAPLSWLATPTMTLGALSAAYDLATLYAAGARVRALDELVSLNTPGHDSIAAFAHDIASRSASGRWLETESVLDAWHPVLALTV